MYPTRKITTYYTAADGTEPDVTVEVSQLNVFDVEVSGLDDVPDDEHDGVVERATEQYWAAARAEHEAGEAALERRHEEYRHSSRDEQILDERSDEDVYEGCE